MLPLRLLPGTTQDDVRSRTEAIRTFYRCARVEVLPDRFRGDRVTVRLFRLPVPPSVSYPFESLLSDQVVPLRATRPLPLGLNNSQEPVSITLFDPYSGGTSLLIGGVPGSGKTTALRVLMSGLAATTACILSIDPTGGAEGALWGNRIDRLVPTAEHAPTMELLQLVLSLIERRGRILGAGGTTVLFQPVCLVCDELAEISAAGSPKQQEEARAALRRIVALSRKCSVSVVMATQRTTSTNIDVTTRSLAAWRLALAHPDDVHGSEALLGLGRREASLLSKFDTGVGYLTNGGAPEMVTVYDLPASLVGNLSGVFAPVSLDEVMAWDEASLHELTA